MAYRAPPPHTPAALPSACLAAAATSAAALSQPPSGCLSTAAIAASWNRNGGCKPGSNHRFCIRRSLSAPPRTAVFAAAKRCFFGCSARRLTALTGRAGGGLFGWRPVLIAPPSSGGLAGSCLSQPYTANLPPRRGAAPLPASPPMRGAWPGRRFFE